MELLGDEGFGGLLGELLGLGDGAAHAIGGGGEDDLGAEGLETSFPSGQRADDRGLVDQALPGTIVLPRARVARL